MSLDVKALAKEINKAIEAKDGNGQPIEVTPEMETYAKAIITSLKSAIVNNPLVNGLTAPAAPLAQGSSQNGLITALLPPTWVGVMLSGFPTSNPANLLVEATASTTYIQLAGKVNFQVGGITGICTSTPASPGPLTAGSGNGGKIDNLSGSTWAKLASPPTGDPSLAEKIYTAISKYLSENAEVNYAIGTVNGVCPAAGGSLIGGTALGGVIS